MEANPMLTENVYAHYARTKLNSNHYFPKENPSEKL